MPLIFFSYARADEEGQPLVAEFFKEIASEVRGLLGAAVPDHELAFFDQRDIKLGEQWEHEIASALQTARVLVCLFSPTYFTRFYCGKEMSVFQARREAHQRKHPDAKVLPPVIIPVTWYPCATRMPRRVADMKLQLHEASYPRTYKDEGLNFLKSLTKYKDEYVELRRKLARRIIEAIDTQLEPLDSVPEIDLVDNLFEAAPPAQQEGPGAVRFVYVAALNSASSLSATVLLRGNGLHLKPGRD
jgi:TIR domain